MVKQRRQVLEQQLMAEDLEDIRKLYKLVEEEDLNLLDGANGVLVEHMKDLFKGYDIHDAQTIADTTQLLQEDLEYGKSKRDEHSEVFRAIQDDFEDGFDLMSEIVEEGNPFWDDEKVKLKKIEVEEPVEIEVKEGEEAEVVDAKPEGYVRQIRVDPMAKYYHKDPWNPETLDNAWLDSTARLSV